MHLGLISPPWKMLSCELELISVASHPLLAGPNHCLVWGRTPLFPAVGKWHWGHGADPGGTTYSDSIQAAMAITRMLSIYPPVGGVPCIGILCSRPPRAGWPPVRGLTRMGLPEGSRSESLTPSSPLGHSCPPIPQTLLQVPFGPHPARPLPPLPVQ